ncbi:unnamed protein product [Ambrosiozyma monospora]|uniref:Unnamed protein product n=1 Tax=Ambrosiozyma monospora TaxID=43982 RepID=A0A9W6SY10_AMBMO|nr:unnamed protein product [Ambrosiozyma monospora]
MSLESVLSLLSLSEPTPEGAIPLKSLVFKPKTPKSQTPIPLILVALQSTQTPSGLLAKAAGVKEPRLANDQLTTTFFNISAKDFTLASLNNSHKDGKVKVVLDSNVAKADPTTQFVLANDSSKLILTGKQLSGFLSAYEPTIVDFEEVAKSQAQEKAKAPAKQAKQSKPAASTASLDDAKLIGVTVDKHKDFPGWYQQILTKGEMLDYYDVSGCYILRPPSYFVWEQIQSWFDQRIKADGVSNAYFPMFVSSRTNI